MMNSLRCSYFCVDKGQLGVIAIFSLVDFKSYSKCKSWDYCLRVSKICSIVYDEFSYRGTCLTPVINAKVL